MTITTAVSIPYSTQSAILNISLIVITISSSTVTDSVHTILEQTIILSFNGRQERNNKAPKAANPYPNTRIFNSRTLHFFSSTTMSGFQRSIATRQYIRIKENVRIKYVSKCSSIFTKTVILVMLVSFFIFTFPSRNNASLSDGILAFT